MRATPCRAISATLKVPCPKCGGEIKENYKKFQCQKCDFSLWKIVAGRQLEIPEVEELISQAQVGPLQGSAARLGFPFAAIIKLTRSSRPNLISAGQGQGRRWRDGAGRFHRQGAAGQMPQVRRPRVR
jgi:endogenous inhibitor of DNA gyrase (YacG/DUF329 family)